MHRAWCGVLQLGVAMFCIFAAYMPAANLASTLYKKDGYYANGATYFLCMLAAPLSPHVVRCCGPRRTFVIGAIPYAAFVFVNWAVQAKVLPQPVYILTAGLLGVGGALLWTSLGVYTNDAARVYSVSVGTEPKGHLGRFNAVPWMGSMLAATLSQIACGVLLVHFPVKDIFSTLGVICAFGIVVAVPLPLVTEPSADINPSEKSESILALVVRHHAARWFILPFFMQGLHQGFMFGTFPAFASHWLGGAAGLGAVAMGVNAGIDAVASVGLGYLSDKLGYRLTLLGVILADASAFVLTAVFAGLPNMRDDVRWVIILLVASLLGFADAGWQTQNSAGIGCVLPELEKAAFALLVALKGAGSACAFFVAPSLTLFTQSVSLSFLVACAALSVWRLPHGKMRSGRENSLLPDVSAASSCTQHEASGH